MASSIFKTPTGRSSSWPLWLVAAICGVGLFLLLCFGVPMLSRRYPIRQFLMVFPPLLLLLATYTLAQALVNGVTWLDEPALGVTSADVMGPAIAAGWCLWMLLAIVTLSALWHVPGLPSSENDERSSEPPTYESLAAQMPKLLVRESSTLFRQVSARTLEAYDKRYGKLHENEEDVDKGIETDERRRGRGGAGIVAAGGAAERGRVSDRQGFDSFGNDIEARPAGSSSAATTTSAAAAASTSLPALQRRCCRRLMLLDPWRRHGYRLGWPHPEEVAIRLTGRSTQTPRRAGSASPIPSWMRPSFYTADTLACALSVPTTYGGGSCRARYAGRRSSWSRR